MRKVLKTLLERLGARIEAAGHKDYVVLIWDEKSKIYSAIHKTKRPYVIAEALHTLSAKIAKEATKVGG